MSTKFSATIANFATGLAALALAAAPATAISMSAISAGALALAATPAQAQTASAKTLVDAAKAKGSVGEQADGYLGFVTPVSDSALKAAVSEINAGRAKVYQKTAAATGVSVDAAGQATAKQLFAKMPAGQYYKPLGGSWTKK